MSFLPRSHFIICKIQTDTHTHTYTHTQTHTDTWTDVSMFIDYGPMVSDYTVIIVYDKHN